MSSENIENKYQCEFCKNIFTTKSNLTNHQRTARYCNNKEKQFKCTDCDKEFTSRYRQQQHSCLKNQKKKEQLEEKKKEEDDKIIKIISNYQSHLINDKDVKLNEKDLYYQKQLIEKDVQLREKDAQLKEKNECIEILKKYLSEANTTIAEIAKKPTSTTTNTNNSHNTNTYMTNVFDINDIPHMEKTLETFLTTDVLKKGQEGLAEMLKSHLLQTSTGEPIYECTDVSRQKFEFRNPDGFIETDPKATKLIRNLNRSGLYNKAHTTGKKIWTEEDGSVNYMAQDVFLNPVLEVMDLDKDSKKLRSKLAAITVRQKNKNEKDI